MILQKERPERGICFAWRPKRLEDGTKVWWEYVHFEWDPGWGWGSGGFYRYHRWVPQDRYDAGERRPESAKTYTTPSRFCSNFRANGPTPCHYPLCVYTNERGEQGCGHKRLEEIDGR